ncbi:MFS transporter [Streptomyces sp. cmx-4-9]|uniref:MFS transporter n=1 Tax=Streptomyces sp. cmx-4-9 TaxID=2790941 RepID=UPI00397F2446
MTSRHRVPRAFGRVWAASGAASFGDGIHRTALPLLALGLTRDPLLLSLATAAALLPWPLLALAGGGPADRRDPRRTLRTLHAVRAVLLLAAAGCAAAGAFGLPLLTVLAFLLGTVHLLSGNALSACLRPLLRGDGPALRGARVRLHATADAAQGMAGPPAGALLFTLGRAVPLAAEALSFLFGALLLRSLPPGPPPARAARGPRLREARAGAAHLVRDPLLLALALRPALGNLALTAGTAVLVLFAREELGLGPAGFALLLVAEAVGGLLGAVLSARIAERIGIGGTLALTAGLLALSQAGLGFAVHPLAAGAALALGGAAVGAALVPAAAVRQGLVAPSAAAGVTAASRLLAVSAAPLGAVLGGWVASTAGLRAPYLAGAVFLAAGTVVGLAVTTNRRIETGLARAHTARGEPAARLRRAVPA